jgi:CRISPR-associated protein Csx10
MNNDLLKIRTLSYLSVASGDRAGIIDVDLEHDEWGIPYIPARRIKGVLRESALEVCEMLDIDPGIMTHIFGSRGEHDGTFYISNCYVSGYEDIRTLLLAVKKSRLSALRDVLSQRYISQCYTELRFQTAIDENGVAQDHSLRVTRVVKPYMEFSGHVNAALLSVAERALLYLGIRNLRRMGLKRNRGFGRVEMDFISSQFDEFTSETAVNILKTFRDHPKSWHLENSPREPVDFTQTQNVPGHGEPYRLGFSIYLINPIVLARQQGDQNTINTERVIPNTTIRGLFAAQLIKRLNVHHVEDHELFRRLFYDHGPQGVYWGSAYRYMPVMTDEGTVAPDSKTFEPAPLFLRQGKDEDVPNQITNIFEVPGEDFVENYIPFRQWIRTSAVEKESIQPTESLYTTPGPRTKFYFHSARNRSRGHSVQGDREIFYYEALEEHQQFEGEIVGPEILLEQVQSIVGTSFRGYIGRSKNAQYGEVEVQLQGLQPKRFFGDTDDDVIITLVTPGIFYNEAGFPDPSWQNVSRYLRNALEWDEQICEDMLDVVAKSYAVEHYVGIWRTKSPTEMALDAGTSFKADGQCLKDRRPQLLRLLVTGLGERTHEGFGRIELFWSSERHMDLLVQQPASKDFRAMGSLLQGSSAKTLIQNTFRYALKEYVGQEAVECALSINTETYRFSSLHSHMIERLRALFRKASGIDEFIQLLQYDSQSEKPFFKMLRLTGWSDQFTVDKFTSQVDGWFGRFTDKLIHSSFGPQIEEIIHPLKEDVAFSYALIQQYWLIILETIRRKLSD